MDERFANSSDFLEHLNFKLGERTATGLNTLIAVKPDPINTNKLLLGLQMAADEEIHYQRQRQLNPNYERQLHGWIYLDGGKPLPRNAAEYQRAYDLANSLSSNDLKKLIGGYGGKRGNRPTGTAAVELAADALYNASYGIDVLTGAPLNYKHNAGHLLDFDGHGQGPTRPEQARVNKSLKHFDGLQKLNIADDVSEQVRAASLYAKDPETVTALLQSLPSSNREHRGWQPEIDEMKRIAKRYHML